MIRKGQKYNYAPHLLWRDCNSKKDKNIYGELRSNEGTNYVSIVYKKDCNWISEKSYYDTSNAKAIPMQLTRTNAGYGKPKLRKTGKNFWFNLINNKTMYGWVDEYYTTPEYWVEDGFVYHGTFSSASGSPAYFRANTTNDWDEAYNLSYKNYWQWMRKLSQYNICYMEYSEDYFKTDYAMFKCGNYEIWQDDKGIFYKSWNLKNYPYIDNLLKEHISKDLSMSNLIEFKKEINDMLNNQGN